MSLLEEAVTSACSDIQEFYDGCSVLVTGATGFMGKVLVEKLLRSCPGIVTIYLLMRTKRGKLLQERVDELVASPCFDRLREENPDFKSKLVVVAGDIIQEGLGISEEDRHLLAEHVNIVFHLAATVRFDEQMNMAIKKNVRATRDLTIMCLSFRKLKALIHVSTAFTNTLRQYIREEINEPPMSSSLAIQMAETIDDNKMDDITEGLLGKWPNSYTFTKALADDVIKTYGHDMPIGIFKPAIVICTAKEPVPGWCDNLNGPMGIVLGCQAGVLRTLQVDMSLNANLVFCDLAINGIIAAAWDVGDNRTKGVCVYNYANSTGNGMTWERFMNYGFKYSSEVPILAAIWYRMLVTTKYWLLAQIYRFFLHTIPGALIDAGLYLTGNKPQMLSAYKKIHKFSDMYVHFCNKSWVFDEMNTAEMWSKMSDKDRDTFPCDMRTVDYDKTAEDTCAGLRKYLLKETQESLPAAKKKHNRLFWLHYSVVTLIVCIVVAMCSYSIGSSGLDAMTDLQEKMLRMYHYINDEISDPRMKHLPMMSSPWPMLTVFAIYLYVVLSLGPRLMRDRKPFKLDRVIQVYNAFQILYSMWIVIRAAQFGFFTTYSWKCQPVDYSDDPVAVTTYKTVYAYFAIKLVDLLDTLFFVLRKKNSQISFLHVYHHAGMLLTIYIGAKYVPGGHSVFLGVINSAVHVMMYSYYLVTSLFPNHKQRLWWKKHITQLQLIQFLLITLHFGQLLFRECDYPKLLASTVTPATIIIAVLFYSFYEKEYLRDSKQIRKDDEQ